MRVALIGATGLVGRHLAPLLARDHELLILSRRPTAVDGASEIVAPIEAWPSLLKAKQLDVAISTLGTAWRQAGSWRLSKAATSSRRSTSMRWSRRRWHSITGWSRSGRRRCYSRKAGAPP